MKRAAQMYPLVEEYLSSGVSQEQFCSSRGLASSSFHYWIKKYKAANQAPAGFVAVNTHAMEPEASMELTYPNGVKLRVESSDLVFISQLLKLC
jgi:transposase-like protein